MIVLTFIFLFNEINVGHYAGTHKKRIPHNAGTTKLKQSYQIYLRQTRCQVRTKSFEPAGGLFTGYCIPACIMLLTR